MQRIFLSIAFCVLQLTAGLASAAGVVVSLRAYQVVAGANGETLAPDPDVKPGDTIEYQVTYHNKSAGEVRQVKATLPVPSGGLSYLPDSALPQAVEASLDGLSYAPVPLRRVVVREGRRQTELVPASEYRYLRWDLGDMPAGKSVTVKSRMRLERAGATPSRT